MSDKTQEVIDLIDNQKSKIEANEKKVESLVDQVKSMLDDANKNVITREELNSELEKVSKEYGKANKDEISMIKESLNQIQKDFNDFATAEKSPKQNPKRKMKLGEAFLDALENPSPKTKKSVSFDLIKDGSIRHLFNSPNLEIELKAAVDMTTSNTVSSIDTGFLSNDPDYVELPLSINDHAIDNFPVIPITDKYFATLVEYSETKGADVKAENTAADDSSFLIKSEEFQVHDIVTIFPVSENMLDDLPALAGRITQRGVNGIKENIDAKFFTTDATNLVGVMNTSYSTLFDKTDFHDSDIDNANICDIIKKAKLTAENNDHRVDTVWLSANNIDKIESLKDSNDNSQMLRYVTFREGELYKVAGLKVKRNNNLGDNELVVLNRAAVEIGLRSGISMAMDYDGKFGKRMKSIRFVVRLAFAPWVTGAIVHVSDIDDALDYINSTTTTTSTTTGS